MTFVAKEGTDRDALDHRVEAATRFIKEALPVIEAKRLAETLRDTALRDPLTLAYNRRYLDETQAAMTALARRRSSSLAVFMCDLDHFKKVNDTYGHAAGDTVLREFAAILLGNLRTSDVVVRYGGEEFLLLLHDADEPGAVLVAERIRAAVVAREFVAPTGIVRTTVSIGVAVFPRDGGTLAQAVSCADAALYRAKGAGRNRVVTVTTSAPDGALPAPAAS